MRRTFYVFPEEMPIRDCCNAWREIIGDDDEEQNADNFTDEQLDWRFEREQECKISTAKKLLKRCGGKAFTEHYDRDGGLFETTPITLKGNNSRFKYNRHL